MNNDTAPSLASQIMADPAAAASDEPTQIVTPLSADPKAQELLKQLPGLVGANDQAIKDVYGKPLAFMLVVFAPGMALHATNTDPRAAQDAIIELAQGWQKERAGEPQPAAANEGSDAAG